MVNRLAIGMLAAILIGAIFPSALRAQQTRGPASSGVYAIGFYP